MARWLKIQKPKVCYTIITAMFGASDDTQAASDDNTQAASDDDAQAALDGNTQAASDVFMQLGCCSNEKIAVQMAEETDVA
jgi:hypothetical protein